jgi:antitoxin PrlF
MREFTATVTSKGQLTLPVEVRRRLGIEPGDKVAIVVDQQEDRAELRRIHHTVESVFGLIPTPPGLVTDDFDDLIEEAMADHADEVIRRMREGLE